MAKNSRRLPPGVPRQASKPVLRPAAYRPPTPAEQARGEAAFRTGTDALQRGDYVEAVKALTECRKALPRHADVLNNLGVALIQSGRKEEALKVFREVIEHHKTNVQGWLNVGLACKELGHAEAAEGAFRAAVALAPTHLVARYQLGTLLTDARKLEEAVPLLMGVVAEHPAHTDGWNSLGTAYFYAGDFAKAQVAYERAVALAPDSVDSRSNLGGVLRMRGDHAGAEVMLRDALRRNPGHGSAANNLAVVLNEQFRNAEAEALLREAIAHEPTNAKFWSNLGTALLGQGDVDGARDAAARAVALDGSEFDAWNLRGNIAVAGLEYTVALEAYERALSLRLDDQQASWNSALVLLALGRFAEGWKRFESRWKLPTLITQRRHYPFPEWNGQQSLDGRTLLLTTEQGYGDTLMFVRFAHAVKARWPRARIVIESGEPMVGLLAACPAIDAAIVVDTPLPPIDFQVPVMSLPHRLQAHNVASLVPAMPYLVAPPHPVAETIRALPGYKVGIVWGGRKNSRDMARRSIPVESLAPLASVPGLSLVSLQVGPDAADLATASFRRRVTDPTAALTDFAATAAAIQACDLVITIDTSVAHLAGALGARTWVLLHDTSDYRWVLADETCPWYPTARLFRQRAAGDWAGVIERVVTALQAGDQTLTPRATQTGDQPSAVDAARATLPASTDERGLTVPSRQMTPSGAPRFRLEIPLTALTDADAIATATKEFAGGVDAAARALLDAVAATGDLVLDLDAGWGFRALGAATNGQNPSVVAVCRTELEASILRRAADDIGVAVQIVAPVGDDISAAGQATLAALAEIPGAIDESSMLWLATSAASSVVGVLPSLAPWFAIDRVGAVIWRANTSDAADPADAAALAACADLGLVPQSVVLSEMGLCLDAPSTTAAAMHLAVSPRVITFLAEARAEAATTARAPRLTEVITPETFPTAGTDALGMRPAAARGQVTGSGPGARTGSPMVVAQGDRGSAGTSGVHAAVSSTVGGGAGRKLAIGWGIGPVSGWGVYGTHLALRCLDREDTLPVPLFPVGIEAMTPAERARFDMPIAAHRELEAILAQHPGRRLTTDMVVLRSLGNGLGGGGGLAVDGKASVGVLFFEDTALDQAALQRGRSHEMLIAGSSWNAEVLRAAGLSHVQTVLQGVDLTRFAPAARTNRIAMVNTTGRFVVFSGGKLEYRKGQDLVIAAFKIFAKRHKDALLVTNWHNHWPATMGEIDRAGHVRGVPRHGTDGQLAIAAWASANGIPAAQVVDVGLVPNAALPALYREADVALFPNRCEGGTNLVAMECMAAGVPVILSANSGHLDLVGAVADARCYPLRTQGPSLTTPSFRGTEGWGESSVEEIVAALESAYADRTVAQAKAIEARRFIETLSWPGQIDALLATIAPLF